MPDIVYPDAIDGDVPAYLAVPGGAGPWPAVVVVQDILGMTADLRRNTNRLATHGYLALAPALYGRGPKIRCMISTIRAGPLAGARPTMPLLLPAITSSPTSGATARSVCSASASAPSSVCSLRPAGCLT